MKTEHVNFAHIGRTILIGFFTVGIAIAPEAKSACDRDRPALTMPITSPTCANSTLKPQKSSVTGSSMS